MTKWISEHALEMLYCLVPVFVLLLYLSGVSYVCCFVLRVFDFVSRVVVCVFAVYSFLLLFRVFVCVLLDID